MHGRFKKVQNFTEKLADISRGFGGLYFKKPKFRVSE